MNHASPIAQEIAQEILRHLNWKDLIDLAVEHTSVEITDAEMLATLRQAQYKKFTKTQTPISIKDLNCDCSYIVHLDGKYSTIVFTSSRVFTSDSSKLLR
jgi:hypothetical protein